MVASARPWGRVPLASAAAVTLLGAAAVGAGDGANAQAHRVGLGTVVSTKDGGQIFGWDINQHGTDGVLAASQDTAKPGVYRVSVETFDQSVVFGIELDQQDVPDLFVTDLSTGDASALHLDPNLFGLANGPKLAQDTKHNRAVLAFSPDGGAVGGLPPRYATVDLTTGDMVATTHPSAVLRAEDRRERSTSSTLISRWQPSEPAATEGLKTCEAELFTLTLIVRRKSARSAASLEPG